MICFFVLGQFGFVLLVEWVVWVQVYEVGGIIGSCGCVWCILGVGLNVFVMQNFGIICMCVCGVVCNDLWVKKVIVGFVVNVIGIGIVLYLMYLDFEVCMVFKELWSDWVLEVDVDGLFDFYGLQMLVVCFLFIDGEVLNCICYCCLECGLCVLLQVQFFEVDYLLVNLNQMLFNGGEIVFGVEFDCDGDCVVYYFYCWYLGEVGWVIMQVGMVCVFVVEIQYVFELVWLGVVCGCLVLVIVFLCLYMFDSFDDVVFVWQEVVNLFVGFIIWLVFISVKLDMLMGYLVEFDVDGIVFIFMELGFLQELFFGEEVQFVELLGVGIDYGFFMWQQFMVVVVFVGLLYEVFIGDLCDVSDCVLCVILGEFWCQFE